MHRILLQKLLAFDIFFRLLIIFPQSRVKIVLFRSEKCIYLFQVGILTLTNNKNSSKIQMSNNLYNILIKGPYNFLNNIIIIKANIPLIQNILVNFHNIFMYFFTINLSFYQLLRF